MHCPDSLPSPSPSVEDDSRGDFFMTVGEWHEALKVLWSGSYARHYLKTPKDKRHLLNRAAQRRIRKIVEQSRRGLGKSKA